MYLFHNYFFIKKLTGKMIPFRDAGMKTYPLYKYVHTFDLVAYIFFLEKTAHIIFINNIIFLYCSFMEVV
jgi:hypothetical protein